MKTKNEMPSRVLATFWCKRKNRRFAASCIEDALEGTELHGAMDVFELACLSHDQTWRASTQEERVESRLVLLDVQKELADVITLVRSRETS